MANTQKKQLTKNEKERLQALASSIYLEGTLSGRAQLMQYLGKAYGGDRDLYTALGYYTTLTFSHYDAKYQRHEGIS